MSKDLINIYIRKNDKGIEELCLLSTRALSLSLLNDFDGVISSQVEYEQELYTMPLLPYNAFVAYFMAMKLNGNLVNIKEEYTQRLREVASPVSMPKAYLKNDRTVGIKVPSIRSYQKFIENINAKNNVLNIYSVPFSRLYEVYRFLITFKHPFLPAIQIEDSLYNIVRQPLSDRRDLETLMAIKLADLHTIRNGYRIKAQGFEKLKYNSAADILLKRPTRYEDRRDTYDYDKAPFGVEVYFNAIIQDVKVNLNNSMVIEAISGEELIHILSFGGAWMASKLKVGEHILIRSYRTKKKNWLQAVEIIQKEEADAMPVAPVYRQSPTNGITTKVLRNAVEELFLRYDGQDIAKYIRTEKSFWDYLQDLHFPASRSCYINALNQLAYIELVYLQLLFLDKKNNMENELGIQKISSPDGILNLNRCIEGLPYELTKSQSSAIKEIISRLNTELSEEMLLSGDVGSGKSTVAQAACVYTVGAGYQAVLAAPTGILAEQLYSTLEKFIAPIKDSINIAFLSNSLKSKEKRELLEKVKNGDIDILVGTHSVFNIEYNNLGLIVIDEQQKFGRAQREKLMTMDSKGRKPDMLCQTATPIPQSTALAFYGDIDLITLPDKPAGRLENITKWIKQSTDDFLDDVLGNTWQEIFKELSKGHQMFIVTPAVETNQKSASVKSVYKILEDRFGHNIKIDYVHGQMKKESQNKSIEKFRKGETQILIASSIIEVGVDIPNATIMLVLDADRFGASSLHQIRGRVGRSSKQGYCYLISDSSSEAASRRLSSLVESNDGFSIALVDLSTRQEGDLFGTQQSGESKLIFCNLADHSKLIDRARYEALSIYNSNNKDRALLDGNAFLRRDSDE